MVDGVFSCYVSYRLSDEVERRCEVMIGIYSGIDGGVTPPASSATGII